MQVTRAHLLHLQRSVITFLKAVQKPALSRHAGGRVSCAKDEETVPASEHWKKQTQGRAKEGDGRAKVIQMQNGRGAITKHPLAPCPCPNPIYPQTWCL